MNHALKSILTRVGLALLAFVVLVSFLFIAFAFSGCATPNAQSSTVKGLPGATLSPTLQAFGPIVAQIAQTRIAYSILQKNPDQVKTLLAVATALDAIAESGSGTEITDQLIRTWVTAQAPKWGLLPGEDELLVQGLLAAKAAALAQTQLGTLHVGDSQLKPWLDAVRLGIRNGVTAFQAAAAARSQAVGRPTAPAEPKIVQQKFLKDTSVDPAGHIALQVSVAPEYAYAVETSADLLNWRLLTLQPIGRGPCTVIAGLSGLPPSGFFRVRYWRSIDADEFANLGQPVKFTGGKAPKA